MTKDLNKKITQIKYNLLNLLSNIAFMINYADYYISHTYSASTRGTDTVLKTKLLSRKMACINIYSVFRFECPHNPMPCCKVFLRWGISKDKSAICLQTSRSNHVWRLSSVGVVFDVYGAVACCNPAFTCCF